MYALEDQKRKVAALTQVVEPSAISDRLAFVLDDRVLCCDFFFQAEDGIRDLTVTGVQTCALPIYRSYRMDVRTRTATDSLDGCQRSVSLRNPDRYDQRLLVVSCLSPVRNCWGQRKIGRASCRERV